MFGRHCPFGRTSCVFHNASHINAQCNFIFSAPRDPDSTQFHMGIKRHGCQNMWHQQLSLLCLIMNNSYRLWSCCQGYF